MASHFIFEVAIHQLWAWRKKVQHNDSFHFPQNPSDLIIAKAKAIRRPVRTAQAQSSAVKFVATPILAA